MYLGFGQKMNFARNRLVENFLRVVGIAFEPQFEYFRKMSTKLYVLLTVIDDVYDSYGTFDELEQFTKAFVRFELCISPFFYGKLGSLY